MVLTSRVSMVGMLSALPEEASTPIVPSFFVQATIANDSAIKVTPILRSNFIAYLILFCQNANSLKLTPRVMLK